jgi:hypothetical protein
MGTLFVCQRWLRSVRCSHFCVNALRRERILLEIIALTIAVQSKRADLEPDGRIEVSQGFFNPQGKVKLDGHEGIAFTLTYPVNCLDDSEALLKFIQLGITKAKPKASSKPSQPSRARQDKTSQRPEQDQDADQAHVRLMSQSWRPAVRCSSALRCSFVLRLPSSS